MSNNQIKISVTFINVTFTNSWMRHPDFSPFTLIDENKEDFLKDKEKFLKEHLTCQLLDEDEELIDYISISKSKVNCVIDYLEIDNNKISMDLEFDFEFELKNSYQNCLTIIKEFESKNGDLRHQLYPCFIINGEESVSDGWDEEIFVEQINEGTWLL